MIPHDDRMRSLAYFKYSHLMVWWWESIAREQRAKPRGKRNRAAGDVVERNLAAGDVVQKLATIHGNEEEFATQIEPEIGQLNKVVCSRCRPAIFAGLCAHFGLGMFAQGEVSTQKMLLEAPFATSTHIFVVNKGSEQAMLSNKTVHLAHQYPKLLDFFEEKSTWLPQQGMDLRKIVGKERDDTSMQAGKKKNTSAHDSRGSQSSSQSQRAKTGEPVGPVDDADDANDHEKNAARIEARKTRKKHDGFPDWVYIDYNRLRGLSRE